MEIDRFESTHFICELLVAVDDIFKIHTLEISYSVSRVEFTSALSVLSPTNSTSHPFRFLRTRYKTSLFACLFRNIFNTSRARGARVLSSAKEEKIHDLFFSVYTRKRLNKISKHGNAKQDNVRALGQHMPYINKIKRLFRWGRIHSETFSIVYPTTLIFVYLFSLRVFSTSVRLIAFSNSRIALFILCSGFE